MELKDLNDEIEQLIIDGKELLSISLKEGKYDSKLVDKLITIRNELLTKLTKLNTLILESDTDTREEIQHRISKIEDFLSTLKNNLSDIVEQELENHTLIVKDIKYGQGLLNSEIQKQTENINILSEKFTSIKEKSIEAFEKFSSMLVETSRVKLYITIAVEAIIATYLIIA